MRNYPPHPELTARVFNAAVRPLDLDVIEDHAAFEQPRLPNVRTRVNALGLKLRRPVAREVFAIPAAVLDDAEAIAPFLAVPA